MHEDGHNIVYSNKKSKKKIERKTVQFKSLTIKEWLTKIIIRLYLKI